MADYPRRDGYLNELDEQGIKVWFHTDLHRWEVTIKVQKGPVSFCEVMDIDDYEDDAQYDCIIHKLVKLVEDSFEVLTMKNEK